MASTMSVGPSHGSPLHGLDLLFRINCMGSHSGRWILGGMGHLYRQAPQVRGCVLFPHGPSRCHMLPEHYGFAEHGNKRQRTRVNTRRRVWCLPRAAHRFLHGAPFFCTERRLLWLARPGRKALARQAFFWGGAGARNQVQSRAEYRCTLLSSSASSQRDLAAPL